SQEFLPHIYDAFCQDGRSDMDKGNGTGLGFSIVKQLVELMEGSITVKSEINKGTEVTVYLNFPLAERPEEEVGTENEEITFLEGRQILLCEDHPLNAKIVIQLLGKKGCHVTWAENGQIGADHFVQSPSGFYDAILMDIRMPVMDGLACTRIIRGLDRPDAKMIPIIALTANAYDSDISQSLDAGINVHLAKPIEPQMLYQTLADYISERKNDEAHTGD
ncbi:MAG: response regulator, partial [Lachnospiraceae bacterium]|nr:response regulator [Lachnospiraceae bacterium]